MHVVVNKLPYTPGLERSKDFCEECYGLFMDYVVSDVFIEVLRNRQATEELIVKDG